jgi:hypothetical protein
MDNTRIPKKSTEWNISWKKTCGKTTDKVGTQKQEKLLFTANGGEILDRPLKKKKKKICRN